MSPATGLTQQQDSVRALTFSIIRAPAVNVAVFVAVLWYRWLPSDVAA